MSPWTSLRGGRGGGEGKYPYTFGFNTSGGENANTAAAEEEGEEEWKEKLDHRDYSRSGWKSKTVVSNDKDGGKSSASASATAVAAVRAALNRIAPDTVEAGISAIRDALAIPAASFSVDAADAEVVADTDADANADATAVVSDAAAAAADAAASAAGSLLAHRGAREAAFRRVYAQLAASNQIPEAFRAAAAAAALAPLLSVWPSIHTPRLRALNFFIFHLVHHEKRKNQTRISYLCL